MMRQRNNGVSLRVEAAHDFELSHAHVETAEQDVAKIVVRRVFDQALSEL
jgi:hypothetical protein